jgi:hypothetical protein
VHQLAPKEVHDSNEKLAGRKSKPSNQMGFKANHGGAVGARNVCLRDGRNQIA